MKTTTFRGELTDISAGKEPLVLHNWHQSNSYVIAPLQVVSFEPKYLSPITLFTFIIWKKFLDQGIKKKMKTEALALMSPQ